ncbi:DNA mismatch repair endonuclease MutL [Vibrio hippocampi]|uniref:DNA mismatch repair protein MutL n=1 Tax=Vibrio hippocampi TaxID=654686 RepID=A0ABN8DCE2_9VIBR|nr:DNA mismatch repair endonuclease MutL [Vibrio hippocampi]CAH0524468.1 DNA mismatch repair protein MutL [Vibrio hippocampi]
MTIKILPARLANQIAAGEVVERPASVVKELVENSLDSGATRIDIDIDKGGAKLIRVRDNGKGIVKDELELALSRHATSKIHTLDDLEAIMSLGFRGEALASISSVARLTLTSRPAAQEQAWSAYAEGRDMSVKLKPAAHPIGTTVEVLDLFFNTPARRKFLRTDKTEFTHIDELLKRIALSRFDVSINLKHNGKLVRQYRAAKTEIQAEKRIASVCGAPFVRNMLRIELEHQGLTLSGWITTPEGARPQSDLQYCYVNGRMMRDKLINHAIRQSYESSLAPDQYAAYVLFIEIDAHQVDVNVHPAKHEVRFHQARLVHDFIYQALSSALSQASAIEAPEVTQSAYHIEEPKLGAVSPQTVAAEETKDTLAEREWSETSSSSVSPSVLEAVENIPAYPGRTDYAKPAAKEANRDSSHQSTSPTDYGRQGSEWTATKNTGSQQRSSQRKPNESGPSLEQSALYQELLKTPEIEKQSPRQPEPSNRQQNVVDLPAITQIGKAVSIVAQRFVLVLDKPTSACGLVSLATAERYKLSAQLNPQLQTLKSQPLLVPLSLKVNAEQMQALETCQQKLLPFGIDIKKRNNETVMVMGVPAPLRQQNLQLLIDEMLSYLATQSESELFASQLNIWLTDKVLHTPASYTLSEAVQLLANLEQLYNGDLPLSDTQFVRPVDFSATLTAFLL